MIRLATTASSNTRAASATSVRPSRSNSWSRHGTTERHRVVSELASLGYPKLPIDTLIRIRDHGVTADYVKEIKALGYPRLEIDDLVGLRDHGVTPDKIRRANKRAGTTLPLDMIKALANGGMK